MSGRELVFWADAIVALMSAAVVVVHRNAVVCALALVMNLCSIAVFFLLLDAAFLFAVQVILYAGAIMVLFLFVVMLLDPEGKGMGVRVGPVQLVLTLTGASLLLVGMARALPAAIADGPVVPEGFGGVADVGRLLFTDFLFPFELASILLLVAMIGAIHMGKKEVER